MSQHDDDNPYRDTTNYQLDADAKSLGSPQTPGRPASIQIFAILNMVFGILGICGGFAAAVMFAIPQPAGNPALDLMANDPIYGTFNLVSMVVGVIMSIVLVAAGVGLHRYAMWGRNLSIAYAWYAILSMIVGSIITVLFLILPLRNQAGAGGPAQAVALAGAIGGMIGGVASLIYPVFILVFMHKADVRDALE